MLIDNIKLTELLDDADFVSRVLEVLQSDCTELLGYLKESQWLQAKNKAHQLSGILYLLQTDDLLSNLQYIEAQKIAIISTSEFSQQVQLQINNLCDHLQQQSIERLQ